MVDLTGFKEVMSKNMILIILLGIIIALCNLAIRRFQKRMGTRRKNSLSAYVDLLKKCSTGEGPRK